MAKSRTFEDLLVAFELRRCEFEAERLAAAAAATETIAKSRRAIETSRELILTADAILERDVSLWGVA